MAFLLDMQFVIFFRTPPQFTITEMIGDLPCADELYAGMSDPEVELEIPFRIEASSCSTSEFNGLSLSVLIETLMQSSWSNDTKLSEVNGRGLFSGICGR